MQRKNQLQALQHDEFDVCIIGAGASGAGAALDAALRGLKVALVDKGDFAEGTSSRSTKLIHGGVRYLEQAFKNLDFSQLKQVKHGLEERHVVLKNAPHLAHPLGLVTPVNSWLEGLYYFIGLKIYDWFAPKSDYLPKSSWLSRKKIDELVPGLSKSIHSGILYFDGQFDDARYCLALVKSAVAAGATVVNYVEISEFQKDENGRITKAIATEQLNKQRFPIRAKLFLNCCGPYSDAIRTMANPLLSPRISPSKGVHLTLPADLLPSKHALLIPKTRDGRIIFAIPFEHYLMLGTTDEPYPTLKEEPAIEADELLFLLETLQPYLSKTILPKDVKAGFGGLRPLVKPGENRSKATKTLLRDHEVELDEVSGLVSLLGGKWTTYRLMAMDAIDCVCRILGSKEKCKTKNHALAGTSGYSAHLGEEIAKSYHFPIHIATHLASRYGGKAAEVCQLAMSNQGWNTPLADGLPYLAAEVVFATRAEMACSIRDVLARRLRIEPTNWGAAKACAPVVAALMAVELGWSDEKQRAELNAYLSLLEQFEKKAGL